MTLEVSKQLSVNAGRIADLDEALAWIVRTIDEHFPDGPERIELSVYWVYSDDEHGTRYYQGAVSGPVTR